MKLSLPPEYAPEPRSPLWASISPDEKWIVFARKHDLFMMDAANYALALEESRRPIIKEIQLTKDGAGELQLRPPHLGTEQQQIEQQNAQQGEGRDEYSAR